MVLVCVSISMYRFLKDGSKGGGGSSSGGRLFLQGTSSDQSKRGPPMVTDLSSVQDSDDLKAVYTRKRLSTEVLGSSFESTKTSKFGEDGRRRITTKIVRKVTTLTRGEEKSREENLTKRAEVKSIESPHHSATRRSTAEPKRVKVRSLSFIE